MKHHILPEFKMDAEQARNWIEDMQHENGNYRIPCIKCRNWFIGHKRRYICKSCAEPDFSKVPVSEQQHGIKKQIDSRKSEILENLLVAFIGHLGEKYWIFSDKFLPKNEAKEFLKKVGQK